MTDLSGSWTAETPFGRIDLIVQSDGSFTLGGHSGRLQVEGDQLSVRFSTGGLRAEARQNIPLPQGDCWWVPLPDSGGVVRFQRHTRGGRRSIDFPSGLRISVPPSWAVRPSPGAMSAHPPEADRPGLPPAAFIEIYETLLPRIDDDHLLRSMKAMLSERTRREPNKEVEKTEIAGRPTYIIHSAATQPTGERVTVKLWVTGERDHILALAQANLVGEDLISDAVIRAALGGARWPRWTRQAQLFGSWKHVERKPSGPLTEVVERSIELSPDGSYRRVRSSILELPKAAEESTSQPGEIKERNGHWYSRDGQLMLSAGLRGYRVRVAELTEKGGDLRLDGDIWSRCA